MSKMEYIKVPARALKIGDIHKCCWGGALGVQSVERLCHNDPIFYLLLHSDCDGELTVEQCALVAPRLRELVASWDDTDWDQRQALRLADGMDEAVAADEPLEFC